MVELASENLENLNLSISHNNSKPKHLQCLAHLYGQNVVSNLEEMMPSVKQVNIFLDIKLYYLTNLID
jgi:hypothetical protein